jgi:hypothetical protein
MKKAADMDSGAMSYKPSFTKNGSGIQMLIGGGGRFADTQTAWRSYKPSLISRN